MKYLFLFLKSWAIGITITAPFDPAEILCIKKTIELGFQGALLVGLGATFATVIYALIAAIGISTLSHVLLKASSILKLSGGLFLLYLAYKEINDHSFDHAMPTTVMNTRKRLRIISHSFFLTIINPMIIVSFMSIFASLSTHNPSIIESCIGIIGIALGSMSWWCLLGAIITKLRYKLPVLWLQHIQLASSIILAILGIAAIVSAIYSLI